MSVMLNKCTQRIIQHYIDSRPQQNNLHLRHYDFRRRFSSSFLFIFRKIFLYSLKLQSCAPFDDLFSLFIGELASIWLSRFSIDSITLPHNVFKLTNSIENFNQIDDNPINVVIIRTDYSTDNISRIAIRINFYDKFAREEYHETQCQCISRA